jgi:putative DNA primase/helicase
MTTDNANVYQLKIEELRAARKDNPSVNTWESQPRFDYNQVEKLLALAENIELFQDHDRTAYAVIIESNRQEVLRVRSGDFDRALRLRYYRAYGGAPNAESLTSVLRTLEARAIADGRICPVELRVASSSGAIYINLGREDGAAVEINKQGWRITSSAPVRFWRPPSMREISIPEAGGQITALANVQFASAKRFCSFGRLAARRL